MFQIGIKKLCIDFSFPLSYKNREYYTMMVMKNCTRNFYNTTFTSEVCYDIKSFEIFLCSKLPLHYDKKKIVFKEIEH